MPRELPPEQAARVQEAIRRLLPAYDKNRRKLGDALGISGPAVSQLLSGKNGPSYLTAARTAKIMGMPVEELLGAPLPDPAQPHTAEHQSRPPRSK